MGIEYFERAVENGGRILRAEQLASADGADDPMHGPGFLLTFDVGLILVAANPSAGQLLIREVSPGDDLGVRLLALDEEEPWWRIAGDAVTRVWPIASGAGAQPADAEVSGVRLQFREDQHNPRVVSLVYADGGVRTSIEDPTHG